MDLRLRKRILNLQEDLETHQSVKIRQIASNLNAETGYYRLLSNDRVSEAFISSSISSKCRVSIPSTHALMISDTTDIDYSRQRNRIKANSGLGYIGNGKGLGYNAHVSLAVDASSEAIYGISDIHLWERSSQKSVFRQLVDAEKRRNGLEKRKKGGECLSSLEESELCSLEDFGVDIGDVRYSKSYQVPRELRESYRWGNSCEKGAQILSNAIQITCIQDREGDLYDTFATIDRTKINLLIRSKNNRPILSTEGKRSHLYEYRHDLPELGRHTIQIRDRETGKERMAIMSLKAAPISILRGSPSAAYQANYPSSIDLTVVYAQEVAESIPEGKEPIFWCLLTTHKVETLAESIQISYWYSLRWLIELFFRLLKKSGFQLESSELETGHALRKLGLLTMEAALKVLQLKQAREGDEALPINAVFSEKEVTCLETIAPDWEGNTPKQKNPFPPKSLPWATWIIARIGGWKGYKNNRPPGILTLKRGLDRFNTIFYGFNFAAP